MPITSATAHILASDNGVNTVLHINPDDAPVAGRKVQLVFYMSSQNPSFHAEKCGCHLTLSLRHREIANPPLALSTDRATASLTFPQAGVYAAVLTANNFRLKYQIRVTKAESRFNIYDLSTQVIAVSALSIIVLFSIAHRNIIDGGRYEEKSRKES
ncbi:MAG TPA: hypothetical protein VLH38_02435 [Patescibacteria group bacterium]|nr:hypothetical protein [Patescibacteria group bacterium]